MLKSAKNVFWEALLITIVIFFLGILLGVTYEGSRASKMNDYYALSEISLMDILSLNNVLNIGNISCDNIIQSNIAFADRIYGEAKLLEDYEDAGKITQDLEMAHKKYDLMRTLLWVNSIKAYEQCKNDFNIVVYLYDFKTRDLAQKATQEVWGNILYDLKQKRGNEVILIPIARDNELSSLDSMLRNFNISSYPVVIINNKAVINEVTSVENLESYLN